MSDEQYVTRRELEALLESAERERNRYDRDFSDLERRVETIDAGGTRGLPIVSSQLNLILMDLGAVKKAVLEDRPWERQMSHHVDETHKELHDKLAILERESAARKHTSSSWVTVLSLLAAIGAAAAAIIAVMHG